MVADMDIKSPYRGLYQNFGLNVNLPPPCTTGFLPSQQRRGIGSKLLTHVIEVAERVAPASQIRSLRLTVAESNTGAQRMYTRAGFRVVDGVATYDRGQRALRMSRPLGGA